MLWHTEADTAGHHSVSRIAVPLSLLMATLVLSWTISVQAKVYRWVDENGTIHIKDYPASMQEEMERIIRGDGQVAVPAQEPADEDSSAVSGGVTQIPGVRSEIVQEMILAVERAFRQADSEALTNMFRYFEERSSPLEVQQKQKEISDFLQRFFDRFGPTESFIRASTQEERTRLGELLPVPAMVWRSVACQDSHFEFLAPLQSGNGTAVITYSLCETGSQAWLKNLSISLVGMTPELAETTALFTVSGTGQKDVPPASTNAAQTPGAPSPGAPEADNATTAVAGQQEAAQPETAPEARQVPTRRVQPAPSAQPELPALDVPPEFLQLFGLLTGTMVLLWAALSLFFYFFFSLCLYLMARKLKVAAAWLAWVPVLNIHTMVASAGKPWTWTALIFLTWLSPLLAAVMPLLGIVSLILMIVVLVLFALIWMSICRRLGMNKWLGLLIYVPIAQWVLMAILAFKKEAVPTEYSLGRVLVKTLIVYILLLAGLWALFTFGAMPWVMRQTPMISMSTPPAPQQITGPVQTAEEAEPASGVASLSLARYEAMLAAERVAFEEEDPSVSLGPVAFQYANFWESEDSPHLWVKVKLADLPNLDLFKSATLTIDAVNTPQGNNVYDAQSNFETEFFQQVSFNRMQGPPARLEAIRSVYLKPGTSEGDIASISGTLTLLLPLNIRATDLTDKDTGTPMESAGIAVVLLSMDSQEAQLQIEGPLDRFLTAKGFDGQGNPVSSSSSSWWDSGENMRTITYGFDGDIQRVQVLIAEEIDRKSYTFALDVQ